MVLREEVGRDLRLESRVDWIIPGIALLVGPPLVDLLGDIGLVT